MILKSCSSNMSNFWFCVILPEFIMVYLNLLRFILIYYGLSWFITVYLNLLRFIWIFRNLLEFYWNFSIFYLFFIFYSWKLISNFRFWWLFLEFFGIFNIYYISYPPHKTGHLTVGKVTWPDYIISFLATKKVTWPWEKVTWQVMWLLHNQFSGSPKHRSHDCGKIVTWPGHVTPPDHRHWPHGCGNLIPSLASIPVVAYWSETVVGALGTRAYIYNYHLGQKHICKCENNQGQLEM